MSNPSDPKPNQPDPTKPGAKPDAANPGAGERQRTGDSSYEFQLPADGSYSDLPPVPQPDPLDPNAVHAGALPPRPTTIRPSSGSFDFIDLGDIDPAMLPGMPAQPLPPAPPPARPASLPPPAAKVPPPLSLSSTDDSVALPPQAAPAVGDSSVTFALPAPSATPLSSFALGGQPVVPGADPASDITNIPDIGTLYPSSDPPSSFTMGSAIPAAPVAPDSEGSFVLPPPSFQPLSDPSTPSTPDINMLFPLPEVPTADPGSFVGDAPTADLDLPMAEPSSDVIGGAIPTATPDLESVVGIPQPPAAAPRTFPTPNLDSVFGLQPPVDPVAPASGWLGRSSTKLPGSKSEAPTKPDATPPAAAAPATHSSSFDFVLPEGVKSYSDMPPLNTPDPEDPNAATAAPVPPSPQVSRVPGASYDFGLSNPNVYLSDHNFALPPEPEAKSEPLFTPTDNVIDLPPAHDPAMADLDLPMAEPSSDVIGSAKPAAATPTPDLESVVGAAPKSGADVAATLTPGLESLYPTAARTVTPTPDLESVVGTLPKDGVNVTATLTPDLDSMQGMQPPAGTPPARHSSHEFELPAGMKSYSEMPPVAIPDAEDPNAAVAAPLPPRPVTTRQTSISFEFELEAEAEAVPLSDTTLKANTFDLPASPAADPEAVVGNLEPVDPVAPASGWLDADVSIPKAGAPAFVPTAEPLAGTFDAVPADAFDGSDIFSGERAAAALPVEHSDVIAATAYGTAAPFDTGRPVEPPRPSEVALSFDGPPGGSTFHDGASDELPIADELADSGTLSVGSPDDPASIHDLPDPAASDPLFDSSRLADTPDLPRGTTHDDATDYGSIPAYTADASSILADTSDPDLSGGDSSSVRMDAPGVGRTHGTPPADAFELTVSDEPVPADLFAEPADGTGVESTDWQSQSGSDLFAEGRATPEIDFAADREGTVDPVDADLAGDQPSLTSAPSSIFSGSKAPTGSGSGSANVRIGHPEPPGDLTEPVDADLSEAELAEADFAEFTDQPSVRKASSGDFELPAEAPPAPAAPADDEGGAIDWDAAELLDDDNATRGIPKEASLSDIMRGLADDSSESPTRNAQPVARIDDNGSDTSGKPVVTVDWMAASNEESAVSEAQVEAAKTAPTRPKDKDRKAKEKADDRSKKKPVQPAERGSDELPKVQPRQRAKDERKGADGSGDHEVRTRKRESRSLLVGALLGGVLAGGAWAGMYFGGAIPNGEKVVQVTPKPIDGNGNGNGNTPPVAVPAAVGMQDAFAAGDTAAALKTLKEKAPVTNEEKAAAGYVRVFAKVQELGKTGAATAGADDADLKTAREELKAAQDDPEAAKSPEALKRAVAASVRLGISYEVAGDRAQARKVFTEGLAKFPKHAAVFEALIDRLDATDKTGAGMSFRTRLTPEEAERVLFAVSILLADDAPKADDPEPGIAYWKAVKFAKAGNYKDAIDFIGQAKAAHLKRAKALAGRGLNPLTDPLEEMFPSSCDQLAAAWAKQMELYGHPGAGAALKADTTKALDAFVKAEKDLGTAKKELDTAKADLVTAKEAAVKLEKDVIAVEDKLKTANADLKTANDNLKTASDNLKTAKTESEKLLAEIATALKPAKVLPEKWTTDDLVAGVKGAAGLAGGVDAQRVVKAEAAAKAAADKLAADTKTLNAKYDTDTAKLKAESAAELKKVTDANAENVKKITDKFAADAKKLTDDYTAALAKLKADHDIEIKAEQDKTAAEKKAAALKEITFQKQLANAVTPAQAVDIWLPVLTDLRRASDAAPAMAIAARALESAVPDSEEAGKAHTVNGMALLLKGNYAAAKDEFQLARRGPAYAAAKGKAWAKAADAGLDATDDPLAPFRQPVVIPPTDFKRAVGSLDAGIRAYKADKFEAAATALAEAAKNDPADPVAWYFLGAVRLALGDAKQADKDIAQGAEREKATPLPARTISAAIAPIQGAAREAIDKARP